MSDWGGRLTNFFVRPLSPTLVKTTERQPLAIVGLVLYDTAVPSVSFLLFLIGGIEILACTVFGLCIDRQT